MDISQKPDPIRSRPVFIRLSPDLFNWVAKLTDETGGSFANTVRAILQGAREEGVSVVPTTEVELPMPSRRRRRRRAAEPDEPQAATG
jgi:hypothetical protein